MTIFRKALFAVATLVASVTVGANAFAGSTAPNNSQWSGFYFGADGGFGSGQTNPTYQLGTSQSVNFSGFLGGLKAGYQVQSGATVVGIEVDGSLGNLNGSQLNTNGFNPPCTSPGEGCTANVNWLTTARGRIGFAGENFMPYVTLGVALAGVKGSFDSGACSCAVDTAAFGLVAGLGGEMKLSHNLTTNAELLFVDLGNPNLTVNGGNGGVATSDYRFAVARVGLAYHF